MTTPVAGCTEYLPDGKRRISISWSNPLVQHTTMHEVAHAAIRAEHSTDTKSMMYEHTHTSVTPTSADIALMRSRL